VKRFWIFGLLSLQACTLNPNPRQLHFVGIIQRDCSAVKNHDAMPSIPIGLTVSPIQAASVLPQGCSTKFSVDVYADTENYYFFDASRDFIRFSRRSVEEVRSNSYVVDGHTGALLRSPKKGWLMF
jgi:hypothetical protein